MEEQKEPKPLTDETPQMTSFIVDEEDYGVDIQQVKEVIKIREVTRLSKAPPFVNGVINWGVGNPGERLTVLLNIDKIFTIEEKIELDNIELEKMEEIREPAGVY